MNSKKNATLKEYIIRINILIGVFAVSSISFSYILFNERIASIPLLVTSIPFISLYLISLPAISLVPPILKGDFLQIFFFSIYSLPFLGFLFLLYRFIKVLQRNHLYIHLSVLGFSILLPLFAYWWTAIRVPTPFGWQKYSNTINIPYRFSYPKEWILTECGNGSVVLSKNPIKECFYPLDASEDYINNLYFQVFDVTGPHLDMAWKEATISAHIKNMVTVFWSSQEFRDRRMFGNEPPLYVDPIKVDGETYTIGQQTFKVTRYRGGFPHIGVNRHEYETNKQLQWVLNSFRF